MCQCQPFSSLIVGVATKLLLKLVFFVSAPKCRDTVSSSGRTVRLIIFIVDQKHVTIVQTWQISGSGRYSRLSIKFNFRFLLLSLIILFN